MKYRQPEEVLLLIQIEDYLELSCARVITSIFNINITVEEALEKIARKGNVFIETPKKFKLVKPPIKLALEAHLKEYSLQNGVKRSTYSKFTLRTLLFSENEAEEHLLY